jgi:phosphoribosylanthranilate isomerase
MLGFILAEQSPRRAPAVLDVPADRLSVAVFVGQAEDVGSDLVQLYTREEGRVRGREAQLLREGEPVAEVVDLPWEEEDPLHLQRAAEAKGRVMLAGRLGPDNVRAAISAVRPWAVDAASRLEAKPGIKDHDKVRRFVAEAR